MVAVHEITWEEATAPDFSTPARHAWREAVAEIAVKAKATLPECNGRVDKAVAGPNPTLKPSAANCPEYVANQPVVRW